MYLYSSPSDPMLISPVLPFINLYQTLRAYIEIPFIEITYVPTLSKLKFTFSMTRLR